MKKNMGSEIQSEDKLTILKDAMVEEEKIKATQMILSGIVQYVFIPALSGFLTAGILFTGLLEKLSLTNLNFIKFPTIKIQTTTSSTYSGLMLTAGLGCVLGLILFQILKYITKLIPAIKFLLYNFIRPASFDVMSIPSVASLIKSLIRMIAIPAIIVLAAITSRDLAKTGLLPGVGIDTEYQLFEVTSAGIIIIAAIGCFLVFLYDAGLMIFLKMIKRKEYKTKEVAV